MRKKMRKVAAAAGVLGVTAAIAAIGAAPTSAAPITCPGKQEPVKVGPGQWECQNPGGNTSGAAKTKNPND